MNQPAVNGGFAPQTLFLGLAASSLASSFLKTEELSARSFLLWGLPAALGLCLLSALLAAEFQARELFSGKGVFSRLGCGVSGLWFAVELIRTVRTAQEVCWSQCSGQAGHCRRLCLTAPPGCSGGWQGWGLCSVQQGLSGSCTGRIYFRHRTVLQEQILGRYSTRNISH